jgi:hypothetical protein
LYRRCYRQLVALSLVLVLSACAAAQNSGSMLDLKFWEGGPFSGGDGAELGIAEMAKGNYLEAEAHFRDALATNPRDVHALLGAAILYQNTGQLVRSRELYEAVLALRPDEAMQFVNINDISTRPVSQVASVNLSLLESGGVLNSVASGAAGFGNQPPVQSMAGFSDGYNDAAVAGTNPLAPTTPAFPVAVMPQTNQPSMSMQPAPSIVGFSNVDRHIISRFSTIRTLRDQGLLTPDEFNARRQANIGALLPLTSAPPAAGLDRPVPTTDQVTQRLQAIGQALAMRAISVSQHSAERSMILDALMPAAPIVIANPAPPPQGLMAAADMVRRLEMLRDAGFISSDEYARERAAVEGSMLPPAPAAGMVPQDMSVGAVQPAPLTPGSMPTSAAGPQSGVHLASYRTAKQAEAGWSQLKRAHAALLGPLDHAVTSIDLGTKGIFFRLVAGPFTSNMEAESTCKKLKSRRQFCDPAVVDFG